MHVRAATAADYDAYARLMPELATGDPIPAREQFASELYARTVVAEDAGEVVGYALFERMGDVGYVRNVASDPRLRRRGIGAALMEAMRARFRGDGATRWCLNVKPDNAPAIALYRRFGFEPAYRSHAMRLASSVPRLPRREDLAMAVVDPRDDAELEAAMGLLPGQLASARPKRGRVILELARGGAPVGVAVMMRGVPGAFPFRVRDPALGPAMMDLLRDHAPLDAWYVQAVVEDDEPLFEALKAHGATEHLEILHMRASL